MVKTWHDGAYDPWHDTGWPEEDHASGSGSEWHSHHAEGEEGHEECRKWDYNSKGTAVAYKRPYQGRSKGKAKGKGKGKWEGYGAASSGCGAASCDAWPDHIHEGKGKGKVKGFYARPGPYESPRAYQRPVSVPDGHWVPDAHWPPPPPDANVDKTDTKAEEEKLSKEQLAHATSILKVIASSIKGTGNMSVDAPKFPSAVHIMETDKGKYYCQPKRDPNGFTADFCLLCQKNMNYEHIGYGPKSTHRSRRQDPGNYFSIEKLEPWKLQEAQRMKEEDEDHEEARKKDEAQKAVDADMALARGDIRDVGEQAMISCPTPMATTEEQKAALVKAIEMITGPNVSFAAL